MDAPNQPGFPRTLIKKVLHYAYRPLVMRYLQSEHRTSFHGLELVVPAGVFHPGLFFSSGILAKYVASLSPSRKRMLDLGCGSGAVGLSAARLGAQVTAVDINAKAVACASQNAFLNDLELEALQSDLFDSLGGRTFDIIAVNPPYYRKPAANEAEHAWNAGPELEYFNKFFSGLGSACHGETKVAMILSDETETREISRIALLSNLMLTPVQSHSRLGERFTIYEITAALA